MEGRENLAAQDGLLTRSPSFQDLMRQPNDVVANTHTSAHQQPNRPNNMHPPDHTSMGCTDQHDTLSRPLACLEDLVSLHRQKTSITLTKHSIQLQLSIATLAPSHLVATRPRDCYTCVPTIPADVLVPLSPSEKHMTQKRPPCIHAIQ